MSVAQKLCDEIVEPAFRTPPNVYNTSRKCLFPTTSSRRYNVPYTNSGSATRSIVIPRKRQSVNRTLQREGILNKSSFRSRDRGYEVSIYDNDLVDTAINTIVTGPLTCDQDCVTDVRKRDINNHKCACKCSHRGLPNCRLSVKQVQTVNTRKYLLADKACSQMVETMSCGTQFLERLSCASKRERRHDKRHSHNYTMADLASRQYGYAKHMEESGTTLDQRAHVVMSSAKRWALNHYPVRGPDF